MKNRRPQHRMMRCLKPLRHPETARDFMEIHLPVSLRQLCDLRTLKLEPGSFIEKICEPIIPMCFGR